MIRIELAEALFSDLEKYGISVVGDYRQAISNLDESIDWRDAVVILAMTGKSRGVTFTIKKLTPLQKVLDSFFSRKDRIIDAMMNGGFSYGQSKSFYSNIARL